MPAVEAVEQLAKFLATYGAWAICAVLLFAVGYLYISNKKEIKTIEKVHDDKLTSEQDKLDNRTDQIMDILTESTAIITQVKNEIRENRELSTQVKIYLERSESLNDKLRTLVGRLELRLENINNSDK